jgi:hypothetical protein
MGCCFIRSQTLLARTCAASDVRLSAYGCKRNLRMCDTYSFSTANMVARTRLSVTLPVLLLIKCVPNMAHLHNMARPHNMAHPHMAHLHNMAHLHICPKHGPNWSTHFRATESSQNLCYNVFHHQHSSS